MLYRIAVVGDVRRKTQAYELAQALDADLVLDTQASGLTANGQRAWAAASMTNSDWTVVLEDDAIPCTDFHTRLAEALTSTPTDVVSLYCGTSYPLQAQDVYRLAITEADNAGANYFTLPNLWHTVGVAIRTPLVKQMLEHIDGLTLPLDEAITTWMLAEGRRAAYTHPSLVDHRDDHTVIQHPDGIERTMPPRKAWRYAG